MISVIIPACDEERYLEQTIRSIREQNHEHEIIVVCDGCSDKTPELAKKLANKIIIFTKRKGPGIAKNNGVKEAKYEKLVFLDADTQLTKGLLKEISKYLDRGYVGSCRRLPSKKYPRHLLGYFIINLRQSLNRIFSSDYSLSNGIAFCTKAAFDRVGGFPEIKKGEDDKFMKRLKEKNKYIMLKQPVISSTRRYEKLGYIRVWFYWAREKINPKDEYYEVIR